MKPSKIIRKIKKSFKPAISQTRKITPAKIFYIWNKNTLTKVETFVL